MYKEGNCKVDENDFPIPLDKNIEVGKLSKLQVPANSFILLTTLNH